MIYILHSFSTLRACPPFAAGALWLSASSKEGRFYGHRNRFKQEGRFYGHRNRFKLARWMSAQGLKHAERMSRRF